MKMERITAGCLALLLALAPACSLGEAAASPSAQATPTAPSATLPTQTNAPENAASIPLTPQLTEQGLTLGIHSVYYPQISGLADAALEDAINSQIRSSGNIEALLGRLALVMSSDTPLQVTWSGSITGDVLSVAMSALGPVEDSRSTEVWSAVNVDLQSGEAITMADLFVEEAAARSALETYLWDTVAPELSAHLERSELTPLPECFTLSPQGITLYYPMEQLSTLSGRAGTVTIFWYELRDHLLLGEDTVLRRIGAEDAVTLGEHSAAAIAASVASGEWPGLPVRMGDAMTDVIASYRRLFDPDLYEGGRMFTLEDGAFRGIYILTDALAEKSVEGSVVQGIRADRFNLYGLCVGQTTLEEWRAILGQPDATVPLDAERAELYRLCTGTSDYYTYDSYRLRLHADEDGVLRSLFLIP